MRHLRFILASALATAAAVTSLSGCDSGAPAKPVTAARARTVPRLAAAPQSPLLMQVYFNTTNGREWIFAGDEWVPHDASVDAFYPPVAPPKASPFRNRLQASSGASAFTPTGAHVKHAAFACAVCHLVEGSPCLDPAGPAAMPARPAPAFDPVTKTCSNVACHGGYTGTFTYMQWNYADDTSQEVTVSYAGNGGSSVSWFGAGTANPSEGCAACHGNPPSAVGAWHAPSHGGSYAPARRCETCHPDVISALVNGQYAGVAIDEVYARLTATARVRAVHANGVVDVIPRFSSQCFGCH